MTSIQTALLNAQIIVKLAHLNHSVVHVKMVFTTTTESTKFVLVYVGLTAQVVHPTTTVLNVDRECLGKNVNMSVPVVAEITYVGSQVNVIVQIISVAKCAQNVYVENMEYHVTRLVQMIVTTRYVGKLSVIALKVANHIQ